MMYKQIECPTCGNLTTAKSVEETQKCRWCRRLFKVTVVRRNKSGKKAKFDWSVESVDFPKKEADDRPQIRSLSNYMDEDIYGITK